MAEDQVANPPVGSWLTKEGGRVGRGGVTDKRVNSEVRRKAKVIIANFIFVANILHFFFCLPFSSTC